MWDGRESLNSNTKRKTYVGGVKKQDIEERAWTQDDWTEEGIINFFTQYC
jgi:hypothetical protein